MSGGRGQRSLKKKTMSKDQEDRDFEDEAASGENDNSTQTRMLMEGLAAITKEIRDLKKEVKEDLTTFKEEFKEEVRREFAGFKEETNRKLAQNVADIQEQRRDITEAQTRIEELEEWNIEAKEAILTLLKQQTKLQEKLTEVEGHGRRCNLRIYNVAERDDESVKELVEQLLRRELELPEGTELHIQRAHRSLGKKPPPGASPRSIVVNFLKFETKENILAKAWKEKIVVEGRQIFFDHDYPAEVMRKRKSYSEIKKILKDKKIRFQTPLGRIRIHWSDGPKNYNNAEDAARDMRERGMEMGERQCNEPSLEERIRRVSPWQRVGERRVINRGSATSEDAGQDATNRAREKLQEFRR